MAPKLMQPLDPLDPPYEFRFLGDGKWERRFPSINVLPKEWRPWAVLRMDAAGRNEAAREIRETFSPERAADYLAGRIRPVVAV